MAMTDCRFFNGYKPCGKHEICDSLCPSLQKPSSRILLVHLGALGAVARSTAILPAIRRKFPGAHVTWVTSKPADQLLQGNRFIDRVLTTTQDDLLKLSVLEFDIAFIVDKSLEAAGLLKLTHADLVYGFTADPRTGSILPATDAAIELWEIGLSDRKKFYENRKSETRLIHEALELGPWVRDPYVFDLSAVERKAVQARHEAWVRNGQMVIGLNTGCSPTIPYKKLTVEFHRRLIENIQAETAARIVLLGGGEDTVRNERIGHGLDVVNSPSDRGLRDGMLSVAACDIVVTGDSLGMHLAIGLGKWTVAWFGPTCAHEIDLYDRGVSVITQASCSPCWKRNCDRPAMCYDLVSMNELMDGVRMGMKPSLQVQPDLKGVNVSCPLQSEPPI
jgi:heptosyltransferase-2